MTIDVDIDRLVAVTVAGAPPLTNDQVELLRKHLKPTPTAVVMPALRVRDHERRSAA